MIKIKQIEDLASSIQKAEENAKKYADDKFEVKFPKNTAFNKNFGTGSGEVAQGNHSHDLVSTSANGFMSKEDKTKLNGIAVNANNYVHPEKHPASMLVQDSSNRLVTDTEKAKWDSKATKDLASTTVDGLMAKGDKSKLDGVAANANNYVHPSNHPASVISQDSNNRFVTDSEKSTWNNKAEKTIASTSANGLMTKDDKVKLDGVEVGANKYIHPESHPATMVVTDVNNRFVTETEKTAWNGKASTTPVSTSANGLMVKEDKTKLDGIATGANNYVHPSTHAPSIIVQDANNRFVTDAEKTAWNGKASTTVATTSANGLMAGADKAKLDGVAANANNYTHPSTHAPSVIVQDANNRFVTDAEKTKWNDKYSRSEVDNKISEVITSLDWKESVPTFADIATSYPNPQDGWTVNTKDKNETYRYDGKQWISISANSIPLVTNTVDGLMAKGDKVKLDGIATNANNYVHPSTHPASVIVQDASNRFVSDAEKTAWNGKASTTPVSTSVNGLMTKEDKTKLDGVATNANNYVHPSTHPASVIVQDASNRFVTDTEKSNWNGKASTAVATTSANGLMTKEDKTKLDGVATNANNYVHPSTHTPSTIAQDANNRFVTDAEKNTWNGKASTAVATTSANGLMASADKAKLDNHLAGSGIFNSLTGRVITIGKTMSNTNYRVSVTPTSNPEGSLGEMWVASKTTTSFTVYCSGSTTTTTFDWVIC